ncbi:hypothetical protein [Priestia endophytica]|jgi:hypothetical protein|uniref:Uncharacterized protein n=2 Tax=Priestia endophytica TaxID=135735 RepID=A0A329EPJ5_9BACI|nr:hypothetical protein [Priestia endophytica]KAB2490386.1 hypothetical protein F8155_21465 [Priestia endophytica]KYG31631.1 hypothetical protein AZF06_07805 [Priestia endophytica]MBG9811508.1 hypothetical protein [Priestia endophytica]MCM3537079.1 hypothetical protein [Priestia endophytica]MED4073439.1 hypothetical protein [Priestia endophytica]
MANGKEPKFSIGDTVVITIYGTVGTITDIKLMDGMHVYEVNHSEGLFLEDAIESLEEYDGQIIIQERIDLEYKYFFGDVVQVHNYGEDLFKIIGIRTEIWRYQEDSWEDIIYELSRVKDGEWLEAGEEELHLVAPYEYAERYIQNVGILYSGKEINKTELLPAMKKPNEVGENKERLMAERLKIIDGLLDVYNDYSFLYEWFKDEEYKEVMDLVLKHLRKIS